MNFSRFWAVGFTHYLPLFALFQTGDLEGGGDLVVLRQGLLLALHYEITPGSALGVIM